MKKLTKILIIDVLLVFVYITLMIWFYKTNHYLKVYDRELLLGLIGLIAIGNAVLVRSKIVFIIGVVGVIICISVIV